MFTRNICEKVNLINSGSARNRRLFLKSGVGVGAMLMLPHAYADLLKTHDRKLSFLNLHTGERISATYWTEGQYQPDELIKIKNILRDHRTDEIYDIDLDLLDILQLLHTRMAAKDEFHVISGYRSPQTNAMLNARSNGVATRSLHMLGKAIDVRLPGHTLSNLNKSALSLEAGGVGYYPRSDFIHIDTGRVRQWSG